MAKKDIRVEMVAYGISLPELSPENAEVIIETCRDIHQNVVDGRKRNTKLQRWDKYWVVAYNLVLQELRKRKCKC